MKPGHDRSARLRVTNLGEDLLLLSVSTAAEESSVGLSETERDVATLAARGLSNAEIAHRRGSSARTVANQLAALYRKLGVRGRRELRARLANGRASQ